MDELFASGIKFASSSEYNFIFEKDDETEASKLQRKRVNFHRNRFVRTGQNIR